MGSTPRAATPALAVVTGSGIEHGIHSFDPHSLDAAHAHTARGYGEQAARALGIEPAQVFKTLLTEVDQAPVCAIVPVTTSLSLKALAQAHGGKRAVMMDPARAQRLTGYVIGGISPLGQRTTSPTYLDDSALDHPRIYVSAGRRGWEISLSPTDLLTLSQGTIAALGLALSDG